MADRAIPDTNNIHSLIAVSNNDGVTPVTLWADPTTHGLVLGGSTLTSIASTVPTNTWRDGFGTLDTTKWNFNNLAASDLIRLDGNAASASWVSIVKSALVVDTYSEITSVNAYPENILTGLGLSISQSPNSQHLAFDVVGVDANNNVINNTTIPDIALANVAATVVSNVATFTTSSAHGLIAGDQIVIYGCTDSRLNFGPTFVSSVPTSTTFTVSNAFRTTAIILGNASYTVGATAFVRFQPVDNYATYCAGFMVAPTSTSSTDVYHKNGDRLPEYSQGVLSNTLTATTPNEGGFNYTGVAYTYPQRPTTEYNMRVSNKYTQFNTSSVDNAGGVFQTVRRTQNVPDPSRNYKIRFRARNLPNYVVPAGPITAAVKTASNVATLTIPNHGLTIADFIVIYGIRDQANFANLTAATQVVSVVDANNITIGFGLSTTASTYGGFVMRIQGQTTTTTSVPTSAFQTYAKTTDGLRLSVVYAASQGTINIGEIWTVFGLVDSTNTNHSELAGRYRVELSNTTTFTVELTPLDGQSLVSTSTTPANCGGTLIRNTELRLHYFRLETETYQAVELHGAVGQQDFSNAFPVTPTSTPNMATLTTLTQMSGFILKDTLLNFAQENSWAAAVRGRIT